MADLATSPQHAESRYDTEWSLDFKQTSAVMLKQRVHSSTYQDLMYLYNSLYGEQQTLKDTGGAFSTIMVPINKLSSQVHANIIEPFSSVIKGIHRDGDISYDSCFFSILTNDLLPHVDQTRHCAIYIPLVQEEYTPMEIYHDDKIFRVRFVEGGMYAFNTKKVHSVFRHGKTAERIIFQVSLRCTYQEFYQKFKHLT